MDVVCGCGFGYFNFENVRNFYGSAPAQKGSYMYYEKVTSTEIFNVEIHISVCTEERGFWVSNLIKFV